MTFFIVEKLATCSMNSYLLPSLFHPPCLFHLHFCSILPSRLSKWTVYPCPIPVIDSASCRIGAEPTCPALRSADLKHLSGISHLIQINPPALTLSLKENGLTRVHPTPTIRSYSPSFFFQSLVLFWLSARQQACSCVLYPWINLSSVCALFFVNSYKWQAFNVWFF